MFARGRPQHRDAGRAIRRETPNAASIAKSVSAFANTYGGWLFYGVNEKSKSGAAAGEFVGIARENAAYGRRYSVVATQEGA